MHKGIYLSARFHLRPSDAPDLRTKLTNAINTEGPTWTAQSHLSLQLKLIRLGPIPTAAVDARAVPGPSGRVLVHLEGDQAAAEDFASLTISQLHHLFDLVASNMKTLGVQIAIDSIEEDSDALDEIADAEE